MSVTAGKRSENERTQAATALRSAGADARRTVRDAQDAGQLAQTAAGKLDQLAAEGKQSAADLQRDLRNAPGAATATVEARDAASRALGEFASAHATQLKWLADDVTRATQATSAAAQRPAPAAEREHTVEATKTAVHDAIRQLEVAQLADRQRAAGIIVDAGRSAEDRARDLRALAEEAQSSTVRFARDEGSDLDRARENAERTGATLPAEEAKALDAPLRETLGPEVADLLDDGARARLAVAARQDATWENDGGRTVRQLREELATLALDVAERAAAVQYASAAIERLSRGNAGERLAADALAKERFDIASYKPDVAGTNQGGIDIVALRRDAVDDQATAQEHLYLIDNKALTRDGNVNSVSALTTNLEQNIHAVAEEFARLLHSEDANEAQRDAARRVLDAIAADRIRLAVTNANIARDGQFTQGTAGRAAKLEFIDVARGAQKGADEAKSQTAGQKKDTQKASAPPPAPKRITVAQDDVRRAADAFTAEWARRHEAEVSALRAARASAESAEQRDRAADEERARARADDAARRERDAQREAARVLAERQSRKDQEEA